MKHEFADYATDDAMRRCLEGEPFRDITKDPGIYEGSQLLNAYTLGCRALCRNPAAQLTHEIIKKPADTSRMAGFLIGLMNQSVTRDSVTQPIFNRMGSMKGRDTCYEAEDNFLTSLGHIHNNDFRRNREKFTKLFYDDQNTLIFIKKGFNIASAVSMRAFTLNAVEHPAGTLVEIAETNQPGPQIITDSLGTPIAMKRPISSISKIVPLRLSAFAFPPEERRAVFAPASLPEDEPESYSYVPYTADLELEEIALPLLRYVR